MYYLSSMPFALLCLHVRIFLFTEMPGPFRSAIISGTHESCQKAKDMVDGMVAEVTHTIEITQPILYMYCLVEEAVLGCLGVHGYFKLCQRIYCMLLLLIVAVTRWWRWWNANGRRREA